MTRDNRTMNRTTIRVLLVCAWVMLVGSAVPAAEHNAFLFVLCIVLCLVLVALAIREELYQAKKGGSNE